MESKSQVSDNQLEHNLWWGVSDLDKVLREQYGKLYEKRSVFGRDDFGAIIHHLVENGYSVIPKEYGGYHDTDNPIIKNSNGQTLGEVALRNSGHFLEVYHSPKIEGRRKENIKLEIIIEHYKKVK